MSLNQPQVRALTFDPDGSAVVEYCIPSKDVCVNGVVLNHALLVPITEYATEIDDIGEAIRLFLLDVLEDLPDLERLRDITPRDLQRDIDDDEEDDDEPA